MLPKGGNHRLIGNSGLHFDKRSLGTDGIRKLNNADGKLALKTLSKLYGQQRNASVFTDHPHHYVHPATGVDDVGGKAVLFTDRNNEGVQCGGIVVGDKRLISEL